MTSLKINISGSRRRGMTLVEVVIAIALAGMLSAGMYASAIYTMRQTAKNVEHIFAVQLASSEAACVRASRFSKLQVGPATLPSTDFEKRFEAPRTVVMDPTNPNSASFTVKYEFSGFGSGFEASGAGASGNWFLEIPSHSEPWEENQYQDHLIVITGGEGANQVMYIKQNDPTKQNGAKRRTKVQLTADLSGATDIPWKTKNPGTSSAYAVDYGMYCDIEVSWDDGAGYKTVRETVYVPNSR